MVSSTGSDGCLFCCCPGASPSAANEAGGPAGPAHAVSCGRRRRHHGGSDTLQFRCCFAQDFSAWLLSRACRSLDPPQGTTGKRERGRAASDAPDAECRHADMELRVCWGPAVILDWTAVNFWHGNPVVMAGTGADKKCPRPSKHRLTNRLDAWLFLTILFFIRYTHTPATA